MKHEELVEALDAIETGMCRVKDSRDIWQDDLIYALCQGVRLLLIDELRRGKKIDNAPAVDAVPVVRCRDCKYFQHYGRTSLFIDGKHVKAGWCTRRILYDEEYRMLLDGFCSCGRRKEDEQ